MPATGYTRQSAAGIVDNAVITAALFSNEFNLIETAFSASDGHTHDGAAGQGGRVLSIGPAGEILANASAILPSTTNVINLGATGARFKDLWMQGNATVAGNLTLSGTAAITGLVTAAANATAATHLVNRQTGDVRWAQLGTANVFTGSLSISMASPSLTLSKTASGQPITLIGRNGTATRWSISLGDSSPETGSNAGSNLNVVRYDDAGVSLGNALQIVRATGATTVNGAVTISSTTASTSTATGALIVAGGVGIAGGLNTGSDIEISPASGSNAVLALNSPGAGFSGTIVGQRNGVNRWQLVLNNANTETGANAGSDFRLIRYTDAGALIENAFGIERDTGRAFFSRDLGVSGTTASTGTSTGALTVAGGLGVAGAAYIGGDAVIGDDASITGDLSVGGFLNTGGTFTIAPATGFANITLNSPIATASDSITAQLNGSNRWVFRLKTPTAETGSNVGSDFDILRYDDTGTSLGTAFSITRSTGAARVFSTEAATSTTTGALVVSGGLGVAGAAHIGGALNVGGTSTFSSASGDINLVTSRPAGFSASIYGRTANINRWRVYLGDATAEAGANAGSNFVIRAHDDAGASLGNSLSIARATHKATFGGDVDIDGTTASTSTLTGALTVSGGVGILGAVNIGGSVNINSLTASTSTTTGALAVDGGVGIVGAVNIGGAFKALATTVSTSPTTGAATVAGGLGVAGRINAGGEIQITPTSGAATLSLNTAASGSASSIFARNGGDARWQLVLGNGTAETGANAGSDFQLTRFDDAGAALGNVLSIVRSTGAATFGGAVDIDGTTASTSTTTGALTVAGGAGIAGNLYAGRFAVDTNGYFVLQTGDTFLNWDANDYFGFARSTNTLSLVVNSAPLLTAAPGAITLSAPTTTTVDPTAALGLATKQYADSQRTYRNKLINSGFIVNQRGVVTGAVLAAGAFGHDRWKAGAGNAVVTFPGLAGPSQTLTIATGGSMLQIIEAQEIQAGNYILSWQGTAQARINGGVYGVSPRTITLTAGTQTTIEFKDGSVLEPQFERSSSATPWEVRPYTAELLLCQRYYTTQTSSAQTASVGFCVTPFYLPVTMRATPTVSNVSPGTLFSATVNQVTMLDAKSGFLQLQATAANGSVTGRIDAFSAEL